MSFILVKESHIVMHVYKCAEVIILTTLMHFWPAKVLQKDMKTHDVNKLGHKDNLSP